MWLQWLQVLHGVYKSLCALKAALSCDALREHSALGVQVMPDASLRSRFNM